MISLVFANPMLLWGLLLVAAPIAIHLLLRRRPPVIDWGAGRFLRRSLSRQRRRRRLQAWCQLLVRSLLLALIVLAAAQPQSSPTPPPATSPRLWHRVILFDSTLSMRALAQETTPFQRSQELAQSLVRTSLPGESWQVFTHGLGGDEAPVAHPSSDAEAILQVIRNLEPGYGTGRVSESMSQVEEALQDVPKSTPVEVLFLTDLQRSEWEQDPAARAETRQACRRLTQRAAVTVVDCGLPVTANLALGDITVPEQPPAPGFPISLTVNIQRFNKTDIPTDVTLSVDGAQVVTRSLPFEQTEKQIARLTFTPTSPGQYAAAASLPADALSEDNTQYAVLRCVQTINVLVIDGGAVAGIDGQTTAADYLELALRPPGAALSANAERPRFELTRKSAGALREEIPPETDVIVLLDVDTIPPVAVDQLQAFVARGKGLLITMGDHVDQDNYNRVLGTAGADLLPAQLTRPLVQRSADEPPLTFVAASPRHPIVADFAFHPEAGFSSTRIRRVVPVIKEWPKSTETIVRLSSGDPLLLLRPHGQGRVGLITTALNDDWGDWVLWPSFLPMIQETVRTLGAGPAAAQTSLVTEPVTLSVTQFPFRWTARRQDGALLRGTSNAAEFLPGTPPFEQPGIYNVTSEALPGGHQTIVRNIDARDSDLARIAPTTLKQRLFSQIPVRIVSALNAERTMQTEQQAQAQPLSVALLLLAAGLLLTDVLLGRHPAWGFGLLALLLGVGVLSLTLS